MSCGGYLRGDLRGTGPVKSQEAEGTSRLHRGTDTSVEDCLLPGTSEYPGHTYLSNLLALSDRLQGLDEVKHLWGRHSPMLQGNQMWQGLCWSLVPRASPSPPLPGCPRMPECPDRAVSGSVPGVAQVPGAVSGLSCAAAPLDSGTGSSECVKRATEYTASLPNPVPGLRRALGLWCCVEKKEKEKK